MYLLVGWLIGFVLLFSPVTVGFTESSVTVSEAAGSVTLQVTLSRMLDASETINLTVSAANGTASELLLYSVGKREIVHRILNFKCVCSAGGMTIWVCVCVCVHACMRACFLFVCLLLFISVHSWNSVELFKKTKKQLR